MRVSGSLRLKKYSWMVRQTMSITKVLAHEVSYYRRSLRTNATTRIKVCVGLDNWKSTILSAVFAYSLTRRRMHANSMIVRNRRRFNYFVMSVALFTASCTNENVPKKDLEADIDEVATTLIEQPLLHSASIGVVYRGKEFIRHSGDMKSGDANSPNRCDHLRNRLVEQDHGWNSNC